jgi:hypothetical protein
MRDARSEEGREENDLARMKDPVKYYLDVFIGPSVFVPGLGYHHHLSPHSSYRTLYLDTILPYISHLNPQ